MMSAAAPPVSQRFSSRWLMVSSFRQLPLLLAIIGLQAIYHADPEAAGSPVALYVLINLIAVAGLTLAGSRSPRHAPHMRHALMIVGGGFVLLALNEVATWGSEALDEDLRELAFWLVTVVPTAALLRRLRPTEPVRIALLLAIGMQALAIAADLLMGGIALADVHRHQLSWIYIVAILGSVTAYQVSFLYLMLDPGRASHGWEVVATLDDGRAYFDVGMTDADQAIAAVEHHLGARVRGVRAVGPIPSSSFLALGLSRGEIKPR